MNSYKVPTSLHQHLSSVCLAHWNAPHPQRGLSAQLEVPGWALHWYLRWYLRALQLLRKKTGVLMVEQVQERCRAQSGEIQYYR